MRTLAYLATIPTSRVKGLAGKRAQSLAEAGITSVADLILHAPRRYLDRSRLFDLGAAPLGEEVTVGGTVKSVSTRRARRNLTIVQAVIYDGTSVLEAVWFNQAFRARQLSEGAEVALSGKIDRYRGKLRMSSPAVDVLNTPTQSLLTGRVVPIHPGVGGISPGHLRRAIHNAVRRSVPLADPLPAELVERLGLVTRSTAISNVHFPETIEEADEARERLVFDELFRLEVALALRKHRQIQEAEGVAHEVDGPLVAKFVAALPYELTGAQRRAIDEIQRDLAVPHPMHRLLQGEVGSGKTVVAVSALLTGIQGGYQGAVMAPTEVLAEQHFMGITDLLAEAGMAAAPLAADGTASLFDAGGGEATVTVALLTGSSARLTSRPDASRDEVAGAIHSGAAHLVVGTHALIQDAVSFHRLGIAVVDEQHRFGVFQRVQLREKGTGYDPDLLIMTATPIPRTLSMTLYGDLDVTLLDEMPPGRTPVETRHVTRAELDAVYDLIRDEVAAGRQVFVVCPLVDDSEKLQAASATAEYERLQGVLAGLRLGLIHGQLRPADKEAVMAAFRSRELDVLVATTVIEVGIDIPNATVMVIEDADRFGLSQLHQLRGRVGRGAHAATCVLVAEPTTPEGEARVAAMVATTDGFRLAEEDLRIRGQGTVFGARQAGMADLRLADILRDADALVTARNEAFGLVAADPDLSAHPQIREEVRALLGEDVEWLFIS